MSVNGLIFVNHSYSAILYDIRKKLDVCLSEDPYHERPCEGRVE